MLLSFRVQNFRSIRDAQELSLVRTGRMASQPASAGVAQVSAVAAIYGGNASGKSNVLDALAVMRKVVLESHAQPASAGGTPFDPFRLDDEHPEQPSRFEVEFSAENIRHRYGFELNGKLILREWLHAYPRGRRQTWFERDADRVDQWRFGKGLGGHNRVISDMTRPDALFCSTAAAAKHAKVSRVHQWFSRQVRHAHPGNMNDWLAHTIRQLESSDDATRAVTAMLRSADLGICDIAVRRDPLAAGGRETISRSTAKLPEGRSAPQTPRGMTLAQAPLDGEVTLDLTHQRREMPTTASLPFASESKGTRALIALSGPVIHSLRTGATLLVDEIDTSLHPRILAALIGLFQSPELNPRRAQLIFTTHDTSLLGNLVGDEPALDRDQAWHVEKDPAGASTVYPLTERQPRKHDNIDRAHLHGGYGAKPPLAGSHGA